MGFTSYNSKPVPPVPTTQEIVASLTSAQKVAVLNGFAQNVKPKTIKYESELKLQVVTHLYKKMDEIEELSRSLMRGEVVLTAAVVDDETGEVTTPVVYNTPPTTASALASQVASTFSVDFTSGQVGAILTKMYQYSSWDGKGTWTFYKNNVIL
jgi:hypothetical protein